MFAEKRNVSIRKPADDLEFVKNFISMGRILQLIGEVLTCPMLVMLSILPKPGARHVIHKAFECNPYLWFVLPVPQRQLRSGYRWKIGHRVEKCW